MQSRTTGLSIGFVLSPSYSRPSRKKGEDVGIRVRGLGFGPIVDHETKASIVEFENCGYIVALGGGT